MRILIAGSEGYIGWPLALHLKARGHDIMGVDNRTREMRVRNLGSASAIPIDERPEKIERQVKDIDDAAHVIAASFQPDAIVHLAQMPSAPYSMRSRDIAIDTQAENIISTLSLIFAIRDHCPNAHLLKLGTMGEYGTPNIDIPEGSFEVEYRGRKDTLPFPRQAGSWYHLSKVHDSNNIAFACKVYGLRATDIMQGVVFGTQVDAMGDDPYLATRFDIDECFGTAVNRFVAQAVIGHPLTVYGTGQQRRGFIPLRDSIQCLTLALESPPAPGEYRVFNQFQRVYSLMELAKLVQYVGRKVGLRPEIERVPNPRVEAAEHYYNPDHQGLFNLGYKPTGNIEPVLEEMFRDLLPHKERVKSLEHVLRPTITWEKGAVDASIR